MKLKLCEQAAVSLKMPSSSFEGGENLLIEIETLEISQEKQVTSGFLQVIKEIDHHHLSEDLGLKTYWNLLDCLDQRLCGEGIQFTRLRITLSGGQEFTRDKA